MKIERVYLSDKFGKILKYISCTISSNKDPIALPGFPGCLWSHTFDPRFTASEGNNEVPANSGRLVSFKEEELPVSQSCTQLICVISMVIRGGRVRGGNSSHCYSNSKHSNSNSTRSRAIGRVIEIIAVVAEMFTVGKVATIYWAPNVG